MKLLSNKSVVDLDGQKTRDSVFDRQCLHEQANSLNHRMNLKRRGEQTLLIVFLAILVITSAVLTYFLYLNPAQHFSEPTLIRRIEVLVASLALIANVGLTVGLIYIYLNQNRVLRDEISILKNQQELMRSEQQPAIDGPYNVQMFGKEKNQSTEFGDNDQYLFSDIDWFPDVLSITGTIETRDESISIDIGENSEETSVDPPENGIRFFLSNNGGGPARKFRLWSWVIVHEGSHEGMWARSPLKRLDRYSLHEYADNMIQSGEQDIGFQGEIQLKFRDPPEEEDDQIGTFGTHSFSEGVNKLVREGTKEIEVVLELRYEDAFEKDYQDQFFQHRANISQGLDWAEFVQKDYPTVRYVNESEQQQSGLEKLRAKWHNLKHRLSHFRQRD